MYIINKDRTQLANMEQITALYIGTDGRSIKADFVTGKGCQIARYDSGEEACAAIELLGKAMGRTETFFFSDQDEIKAHVQTNNQRWHHATGKKTKGHGGS